LTLAANRVATAGVRTRASEPLGDPSRDGSGRTHVFIVGAGYVGLVTAVGMARLGHRVTLADIDAGRVAALEAGDAPIWEPGLQEALADVGERLAFTTKLTPPADATFSFVTVGTPLRDDGLMDMANVERAVRALLDATSPEHVVVVRSTLMPSGPGALAELRGDPEIGPALVTNPEFLREGSALRDFERPGRIVAGWLADRDRAAAEAVVELYSGIDAPGFVADARSVAMIKIASNVFLAMKVAYANELARLCDAYGANAPVVADGIGLDDRIGRAFLDAGPGIGGSCLPEQAVAMDVIARTAGVPAPLIGSVARANDVHRTAIVHRLAALMDVDLDHAAAPLRGKRVAVLGLAFKANTDDVRQSAAMAIAAELRDAGASVVGMDPRAAAQAHRADPALEIAETIEEAVAGADAVLVATEWQDYRSLDWASLARSMRGTVVYDTRAIVDAAAVEAAGLRLERLGRPVTTPATAELEPPPGTASPNPESAG
jgi:UDPglucose 6-dehydrogenase